MKEHVIKIKNKSIVLLKDSHFWRIQGLSVQYFLKYYTLYSLQVLLITLLIPIVISMSSPLSEESNLVIVKGLLQLFVFATLVMTVVNCFQLFVDSTFPRVNRNNICKFLKACLFAIVVINSNILSVDFYLAPVVEKYVVYVILYFSMCYSIQKYWNWLGKTIILNPELSTPVKTSYFKERIEFQEEMGKYVVPLALTKEMVRIGEKQTVETKNRVTVQLKYSLIPPVDLLEEKYDNTGSN